MFLLRDIQRTASSLYKQGLLDLIKGMQSVSARALKRTHVSSGGARSDGSVPVSVDSAHGGPRPCGTPAFQATDCGPPCPKVQRLCGEGS